MKQIALLYFLAPLLVGTGAHAQASPTSPMGVVLHGVEQAPIGGPLSGLGGGFQISAGQDDGNVSLKASHTLSESSGGPGSFFYSNLSFTLSSPVSKGSKDKPTDFASLGGFADSTSLEVNWLGVRLFGANRTQSVDQPKVCNSVADNYEKKAAGDAKAWAEDHPNPSENQKQAEADREKAIAKEISSARNGPCAQFVEDHGSESDQVQYASAAWSPQAKALIGGLIGKVGYNKFDFVDATTLKSQSVHKTPWSVGPYIGLYPRSLNTLFLLTYQYADGYDDQDSKTVCPAGTPPVTCVTGALGEPKHTTKELVSLEVRHLFKTFGIAPVVTRDTRADVWIAEVPIYFISNDKKDGFIGGVKFGWRSDDHDFRASVFIGKAFSALTF